MQSNKTTVDLGDMEQYIDNAEKQIETISMTSMDYGCGKITHQTKSALIREHRGLVFDWAHLDDRPNTSLIVTGPLSDKQGKIDLRRLFLAIEVEIGQTVHATWVPLFLMLGEGEGIFKLSIKLFRKIRDK